MKIRDSGMPDQPTWESFFDAPQILRRLADERKTVLISSHILAEMNEFCTSVAIMERGELKISGRIEDVNRQVMGDQLISIEVLGGDDVLLAMIRGDDRAGPVERASNTFEFRFRGDALAASELLAGLIRQGVPVSGFQRRRDNLEDLFLKVGSKELS